MKKTSIGGQALIEGLLMVGPEKRALASLLPDGEVHLEYLAPPKKRRSERYFLLRGMVKIWDQLRLGFGAMLRAAEIQEDQEQIAQNAPGEKKSESGFLETALVVVSALIGLAVFFLLPNLLMQGLLRLFGGSSLPQGALAGLLYSLGEAGLRIGIFLAYLWLCSRQKDIARVWQFHGAEHKCIACYEAGRALEVAEVQAQSRFHPRCGTSFLFIIVLVAALLYALVGWHGLWLNLLIRLALIPLLAGLSYEVLRYSGRHASCRRGRILAAPGLWLQRLTTREPDADQMRVAIRALEAVLPSEEGADDWDRS